MAINNIQYENLRAEMARKNLSINSLADAVGMNRDTLSRKLSGKSPLFLDEAINIQRTAFDDVGVLELFDAKQ